MGIVYLIYFEKLSYVGSTGLTLYDRMYRHKSNHKSWQEGKQHYCSSYEIIQHDEYEVMIIEEVANETEYDLRCRERFWIDWYGIDNLVNKSRPLPTIEEKLENSKKRTQKYRDANRDKVNRQQNERRAANRDERNRKKREYRSANRDEINRKRRERRAARKAKSD